jgi:hypothetical protein
LFEKGRDTIFEFKDKTPNLKTLSNGSGVINFQGQPKANAPLTWGWGRRSSGRGRGDGRRRGISKQSQVNIIEVTIMGD